MIDTNLIIGRLGSGKTTAIKHFLKNKPENENWAIIINEFGQIGIDAALLNTGDSDSLTITEISGGCICCAAQTQLRVTLTKLIRQYRPERIIIEATGLGHPAGIIDLLRDEYLQRIISINSIITFIDVTLFTQSSTKPSANSALASESFSQQLQLADIIVLNKSDLSTDAHFQHANSYLQRLYPKKQTILSATQAQIDIKWLSHISNVEQDNALSGPTGAQYHSASDAFDFKGLSIQRFRSESGHYFSFGYILPASAVFNRIQMLNFIHGLLQDQSISIERLKAVLNCRQHWYGFNAVNNKTSVTESFYRRDNRIEFISANKQLCTEQIEHGFLCQLTSI
ncbi:MAG: GTP-binding protein [Gammaproteobacteria bacterium]|nr:GTP-binding protein [Gammaproteobacteria bacterium]